MPTTISPLSQVDPRAELGVAVTVGPFCVVGPDVIVGDRSQLDSHVSLLALTRIGRDNRFCSHSVIGGDPQDKSFRDSDTRVEIGDENTFREGVTVNRGAKKDEGVTRIGSRNLLMANSHVAHNCHVHDDVILVNGVLLGGHVHVHDRAIVSGNSVVHHYSTLGHLSFVSGGCRVPHDIAPFMLAAGSDKPAIRTINRIGMQRAGISVETIEVIKSAYKLLFRERQRVEVVHDHFEDALGGVLPIELTELLGFINSQQQGHMGRARDPLSETAAPSRTPSDDQDLKAA